MAETSCVRHRRSLDKDRRTLRGYRDRPRQRAPLGGDSTIVGTVKAAKKHGKGIVIDLIGVADKPKRAKETVALGVEFAEMHAGLDAQAEEGFTFGTLLHDGKASGVPF